MSERPPGGDEKRYWLDDPRNVRKIAWALAAVCLGLFFADGFYEKHEEVELANLFGFYAIFGFTVYVGLVLVAKRLRGFLMRSEDYYERDD